MKRDPERGLFLYRCQKLHLDFDVATSRQAQVHETVDGLGGRFEHIDKTLVGAHLELLAALFVDVGAFDDREGLLAGWQWDWASKRRAGAKRRVDDLLCCLVNDFVVVGLQTNTNPLFALCWCCVSHGWFLLRGFAPWLAVVTS